MKKLGVALALLAAHAHAEPRRALQLLVSSPTCTPHPASLDETSALVEIEVRAQNIQTAWSSPGASARLSVIVADCEGRQTTLRLESADLRRTEVRELDTTNIDPTTRPRVIALATAELLRVTRVFDAVPAPAIVPPPPPAPPVPERFLEVSGQLRVFATTSTALAGPHVELTLPTTRWSEVAIGAGVGFGGGEVPLGSVHLGLAALRLAPRLVSRPSARWALAVGPSAEVGAGWASGSALAPGTVAGSGTASVFSLGLGAMARAEVAPRLWLTAGLEGAGALVGFRAVANGRTAVGALGLQLGTTVGVALSF